MWTARVVWATLPFAVGSACADALGEWSRAAAAVAAVLLWAAWAVGLVALVSPRPWGFTVLRVTSTAAVLVAVVGVPGRGVATAAASLVGAFASAATACSSPVAHTAANAASHGHEQRFPLRAPTPIAVVALPFASALVIACVAAGPLLVATGTLAGGIAACIGGFFVARLLARSIHSLSQRWVLVERAGIVIADPLSLADPVLLPGDQIESLRRLAVGRPAEGTVDLRLGTLIGSIEVRLREPAAFARRKRRGTVIVSARAALVAPLRADALLAASLIYRIDAP